MPAQENIEHTIWKNNGLINVAGGKLTTFRVIAQEVLKLASEESELKSQLEAVNFERDTFNLVAELVDTQLPEHLNEHITARYGSLAHEFIQYSDYQYHVPIGYSINLWSELIWAMSCEQVQHLDDLLLRRTHIGNILPNGGKNEMEKIRALCFEYMNWSEDKWQQEFIRYQNIWKTCYSLPKAS